MRLMAGYQIHCFGDGFVACNLELASCEVLKLFLNKCKYTYNKSLLFSVSSVFTSFIKKSAEFLFSSSVEYSASAKSAFKFKDRFLSLLKLNSADSADQLICKCKYNDELSSHMINKCRTKCKMN